MKRFSCLRRAAALVFVLPFFAACSPATTAPSLAPVAELRPGILQGYLSPQAVPNSLALVSPPPTQGSAAGDRSLEDLTDPLLHLERTVTAHVVEGGDPLLSSNLGQPRHRVLEHPSVCTEGTDPRLRATRE